MTVKIDPITGDVTLDKTLAADLREYVVRTTQYGGPLEPLVDALPTRNPFELTLNGDRDRNRADVKVARVEPLKYAPGDEVRTEDDYANAPVGTTVRKANLTNHAGYTKLLDGRWQGNEPGWETIRLTARDMARNKRIVVASKPKAVAVGDWVELPEALDALPVGSRVGYGAGNRNATCGYEKQTDGSWLDYRNNTFRTSSKGLAYTPRMVFRVGPAQPLPKLAVGDYAQSVGDYDSLPTGATVWANFGSRSNYWTKQADGEWLFSGEACPQGLGGTNGGDKREVRSLPSPEPGTVGYGCRTAAELDALPVGATLWFHSRGYGSFFTKKANNQFGTASSWVADNNWLLTKDDAPAKGRVIRSLPEPASAPKVGDLFVPGLPVGSVVSYDDGIRWVKGADGLWRDERHPTEDGVADSTFSRKRTIRRIGPARGGMVNSAEDYADLPVRSLPRAFKVGDELVTEADHDAAPAGTVVAYSNQGCQWRKDTDGRWRYEGTRPLSGSGVRASSMATPFDRSHRRIVSLP